MPVSGLVVSLARDPEQRADALKEIRAEERIEIGTIHSNRMSIVTTTDSAAEDQRLWCWLNSIPGVVLVDVAMIGFDETESPSFAPCNVPATKETIADGC